MAEEENNSNFVTIVIAALFFVYIGYMLYNTSQIDAWRWPIFILTPLLLMIVYQNIWGDWLGAFLPAQKEFRTMGLTGRQIGMPEPLPEGKERWRAAFNTSYLPKHIRKRVRRNRYGGAGIWLIEMFTGVTVVEIIDKRHKFKHIDPRDCDNPNGCVWYIGKLDGGELTDPNILSGQAEIQRLTDHVSALSTSMRLYGQQLALLTTQRHFDDADTASRFKVLADNMKNIKILPKGGAGAEQIVADMM